MIKTIKKEILKSLNYIRLNNLKSIKNLKLLQIFLKLNKGKNTQLKNRKKIISLWIFE